MNPLKVDGDTMEIRKMVSNMVMGIYTIPTETNLSDAILTIKKTVKEFNIIRMARYSMENGKMVSNMVKEYLNVKMVQKRDLLMITIRLLSGKSFNESE